MKYSIIIDRVIGVPGHGKNVVDGINAYDKKFLMKKMCMIEMPEADNFNKRIAAHCMLENFHYSFPEECK